MTVAMQRPAGLLVATLAMLAAGACSGEPRPRDPADATPRTSSIHVSTAPETTAPSGSSVDDALARGVAFLAEMQPRTDVGLLAIQAYVQRRFSITELSDAERLGLEKLTGDPETNPEWRLTDPRLRPSLDAVRPDRMERGQFYLFSQALACDVGFPESEFRKNVRWAIDDGGYALTHAVVAFRIRDDLGCADDDATAALRDEAIEQLRGSLRSSGPVDDLELESLAALEATGSAGTTISDRLGAILAGQLENGSWVDNDEARGIHATTLAVWVLASVTRPAVEDAKLARVG